MTYFLVWGCGKQAYITILHWTCWAVLASSWSGKSTSGVGQACRSALYGGGHASGGHSQYWKNVSSLWILGEQVAMRVQHQPSWDWHRWAFYIGCDLTGGVALQKRHNLQVPSSDTLTKHRHAAPDDVGRYTQGNLQMVLKYQVCNAWSCDLHRERCNTRYWCWDFV